MGRWGFLLVYCIGMSARFCFAAFPSFGTYIGTLKHDSLGVEQLVKLELISSREEGNTLELIGILTLHMGDFRSGEYANYHFDKVIYQPQDKNRPLVFDQADQEVTITVDSFKPEEIRGKLLSNYSNSKVKVGDLLLHRDRTVTPTLPLIRAIGGEYSGQCGTTRTRLRIQTFRSTADTSRVGNPFSAYEMRAQIADAKNGQTCPLGLDGFCIRTLYQSGTYNFFKNDLRLMGPHQSLKCEVTISGLDCGKCKLKAVGNFSAKTFEVPFSEPVPELNATTTPKRSATPAGKSSIEGSYRGYLHHEYLNVYQPASVNIATYQAPAGTGLMLSAGASLFFGTDDSAEFIPYRFEERFYPNDLFNPKFVFKRSKNDVDAILQIIRLKDGEIRGTWFSILFGRVGTFTLRKEEIPRLPKSATILKALTAPYENSDWDLDLAVNLDKTPPNTDNPFFPLALSGHFYHKDGITPRIAVTGGSYNFYTGKIAFQMGGQDRVMAGDRGLDGKLKLQWTPATTLTPLLPSATVFRIRPTGDDYL